jgi:SAM-dependent methyltransferase
LEIGAGPGSITKHLIRKNRCDVVAVEIEPTAIKKLKEICQNVYQLDLNDPSWTIKLSGEEKFDVVIAADVLEHTNNPLQTLTGMKNLLREGGEIILSLPHVGHSAIVACIMSGDFEYRDWGLLDRTHIRFFGIKNINQLHDKAELNIIDANFVLRPPTETEFAEKWAELPLEVRQAVETNPFGNVYQVVTKAQPRAWAKRRLDLTTPNRADTKLIAFYLPQFHPTPENDLWWGKGFTEWTNTTRATASFEGHYQPHLPTDLGFYDLRLRETRREQIKLAKVHGIDAFCYHYYWFSGKRILYEPVDDMLRDKDSDMPFCLCWANENWTRRWDGAEHEVLIAQKYLPDDDVEFIKSVIPFFNDKRYLRKDGAPILIVYRPQHLLDSKKTTENWREYCRSVGIGELHLVCALTRGNDEYIKYGFDAGVEFPPHAPGVVSHGPEMKFYDRFRGTILNYAELAESYINRTYPDPNVYKTVLPSWDNTARTGQRALIIVNGTPENYEFWLKQAIRVTAERRNGSENLVFINAWNEWAEGCHLEPDQRYGRQFLEATLRVKEGRSLASGYAHVLVPTKKHRRPITANMLLRLRRMIGNALRPFPATRGFAAKMYNAYFYR